MKFGATSSDTWFRMSVLYSLHWQSGILLQDYEGLEQSLLGRKPYVVTLPNPVQPGYCCCRCWDSDVDVCHLWKGWLPGTQRIEAANDEKFGRPAASLREGKRSKRGEAAKEKIVTSVCPFLIYAEINGVHGECHNTHRLARCKWEGACQPGARMTAYPRPCLGICQMQI